MTLAVDHVTVRSDARAYALGLVNNDSNDSICSAEKKISRLAHRDAMRPKISQPRISAERQSDRSDYNRDDRLREIADCLYPKAEEKREKSMSVRK